ncbi:MAG: HD domain-containing protein [Paludibacteraceae bacterium]|nr:HD domain-containing protein [Paludibacteraceae bacterium]
MNPKLINYIEDEVIPRYKAFDKAHNIDHVMQVIQESLLLAKEYGGEEAMCYVIAAYHDLGLINGRERHHIDSGIILMNDHTLESWFDPNQLLTMKEAIEDHRASNENPPRSLYGEIVAEADRCIEPIYTIRRAVQYGLNLHPEKDKDWQYQRVVQHMEEKYAEGGYLKLFLDKSSNAKNLAELRRIIKDKNQLKSIFDQLYKEEAF